MLMVMTMAMITMKMMRTVIIKVMILTTSCLIAVDDANVSRISGNCRYKGMTMMMTMMMMSRCV